MSKTVVEIEGKELTLSNLEKELYPSVHFTKADVIDYYVKVAPYIIPHLEGHGITLKRYPGGVDESFFYEKRCPSFRPEWVETQEGGKSLINFCVAGDLPSLVWLANLASLELHLLLSKENPEVPTMMVFDLDPGPPANIIDCIPIAFHMRELLKEKGMFSFAKTSGGKGLHIFVPLNNNATTFDDTKEYSRAIARAFEAQFPDKATSNMKKDQRVGKVFIDWSQNDMNKTTVSVYSLRARELPTVSTPVTWKELDKACRKKDAKALEFQAKDVIKRVKKYGDLFEGMLTLSQKLK